MSSTHGLVESGGQESAGVYGDLMSQMYDGGDYGRVTAAEVEFYLSLAGGRRTLEIGSGTGRLFLKLLASALDLYGIESSASMLSVLAAKIDDVDRGRLRHWNALETPFPWPDRHFGCIIVPFSSFGLLHSGQATLDDNRVFREFRRLLPERGRVAINDMRTERLTDAIVEAAPEIEISRHRHHVHGDVLHVESSHFRAIPTRLFPRQVVRHRRTVFTRLSDLHVLESSQEAVPVWDVDGFITLAADAGFRHIGSSDTPSFHYVESVTHLFERR